MLIDKPRIPIGSILLYGLWPGFIKILLYRLKGYRIGKGVSIGLGAVICGDRVEVGDYTSIVFLTIIGARNLPWIARPDWIDDVPGYPLHPNR